MWLRRLDGHLNLMERMQKNAAKVLLPTMILSNAQSIKKKADELRANTRYLHEYREAYVLAFSETWLNETVPDSEVCPEGLTITRMDRCSKATGKEQGGGVCVMINDRWSLSLILDSYQYLCVPIIFLENSHKYM